VPQTKAPAAQVHRRLRALLDILAAPLAGNDRKAATTSPPFAAASLALLASLAQRSAEAAKEIKSLIGDSVVEVEAGAQLVDSAGSAMGEIVTQVRRVTDLINEITSSTMEQSSGISQVNIAVSQLDQMTQQNAALVEQSAAAADSLKGQAGRLVEAVGAFSRQ